jgi:GTPase-activating protein SAC7
VPTLDLAVIFRPALLSHPTHELSPPEHQLSQDVLEFLIEHQDWFMLDISTPAGAGSRAHPPVEPVDMDIRTDDEWIPTGSQRRVTRRRTTSERPGGESVSPRHRVLRKHPRRTSAEPRQNRQQVV